MNEKIAWQHYMYPYYMYNQWIGHFSNLMGITKQIWPMKQKRTDNSLPFHTFLTAFACPKKPIFCIGQEVAIIYNMESGWVYLSQIKSSGWEINHFQVPTCTLNYVSVKCF